MHFINFKIVSRFFGISIINLLFNGKKKLFSLNVFGREGRGEVDGQVGAGRGVGARVGRVSCSPVSLFVRNVAWPEI